MEKSIVPHFEGGIYKIVRDNTIKIKKLRKKMASLGKGNSKVQFKDIPTVLTRD